MINISKLYCGLAGQSDNLRYSREDSAGPVVVYNCTSRCNLNCLHCYSYSQRDSQSSELTTAQAKKLIRQLAEADCPVVLFSGGEPLLREDLLELLAEAAQLGLRCVISSNGTLIDSSAAQRLRDASVNYVGISLDGDQTVHDKFRAAKGSFKAAVEGIENCKKAGLKTGLRFTITKTNSNQVRFIFDIAASTGVRRICFYHLVRTGRAQEMENQALNPDQIRHLIDTIIEKTDDFVKRGYLDEVLTVGNHADGPYLLVRMKQENNHLYDKAKELLLLNGGNRTGEKIGCVSWDGSVHPDQFWRNYSLGNIRDKPFSQIWENSAEPVLHKLRNKTRFGDKRCLKCRWFELCKGNFRFLNNHPEDEHWLNEPACYLKDEEITKSQD